MRIIKKSFCLTVFLAIGPLYLSNSFCQIRSDFLVEPDTTFSTHLATAYFDDNSQWQIIYAISDTAGNFFKHTIFDAEGEVIRAPHFVAETSYGRLRRLPKSAFSKNYGALVFSDGVGILGFGIAIRLQLLTSMGDPIGSTYSRGLSDHHSSIDVSFLNDSTYVIVYDAIKTFFHEVVCFQFGLVGGELIEPAYVVNDDSVLNYLVQQPIVISNPDSGNFVVIWQDNSLHTSVLINDFYGRIYDANGNPLTARLLLVENREQLNISFPEADIDSEGNFILVWGAQNTLWNIYLRRFHSDGVPKGDIVKVNESDGTVSRPSQSISIDNDDKFLVVWNGGNLQLNRIFAQRFAKDGSRIGENFMVSTKTDASNQEVPSVLLRNDRIYTIWTDEPPGGQPGKKSIWGNILDFDNPVSVAKPGSEVNPIELNLFKNYPNPFNPTTTIKYELSHRSQIRLVIYNVLGKEIITLVNKEVIRGSHEVQWNGLDVKGGDVATGIYFYRLSVGSSFTKTRKMVLVR